MAASSYQFNPVPSVTDPIQFLDEALNNFRSIFLDALSERQAKRTTTIPQDKKDHWLFIFEILWPQHIERQEFASLAELDTHFKENMLKAIPETINKYCAENKIKLDNKAHIFQEAMKVCYSLIRQRFLLQKFMDQVPALTQVCEDYEALQIRPIPSGLSIDFMVKELENLYVSINKNIVDILALKKYIYIDPIVNEDAQKQKTNNSYLIGLLALQLEALPALSNIEGSIEELLNKLLDNDSVSDEARNARIKLASYHKELQAHRELSLISSRVASTSQLARAFEERELHARETKTRYAQLTGLFTLIENHVALFYLKELSLERENFKKLSADLVKSCQSHQFSSLSYFSSVVDVWKVAEETFVTNNKKITDHINEFFQDKEMTQCLDRVRYIHALYQDLSESYINFESQFSKGQRLIQVYKDIIEKTLALLNQLSKGCSKEGAKEAWVEFLSHVRAATNVETPVVVNDKPQSYLTWLYNSGSLASSGIISRTYDAVAKTSAWVASAASSVGGYATSWMILLPQRAPVDLPALQMQEAPDLDNNSTEVSPPSPGNNL